MAFDLFKSNKIVYPFVFGVATAQGTYVMVINNLELFNSFGSQYFLEDSNKDPEDLDKLYKAFRLSLSLSPEENEILFLKFLNRLGGTGIEILKANNDFSQYQKLTLINGQLQLTPCN